MSCLHTDDMTCKNCEQPWTRAQKTGIPLQLDRIEELLRKLVEQKEKTTKKYYKFW